MGCDRVHSRRGDRAAQVIRMKPLSPRTQAALRDLIHFYNQALKEPVPEDMKATLRNLK